jgi:hypothetical protein
MVNGPLLQSPAKFKIYPKLRASPSHPPREEQRRYRCKSGGPPIRISVRASSKAGPLLCLISAFRNPAGLPQYRPLSLVVIHDRRAGRQSSAEHELHFRKKCLHRATTSSSRMWTLDLQDRKTWSELRKPDLSLTAFGHVARKRSCFPDALRQ